MAPGGARIVGRLNSNNRRPVGVVLDDDLPTVVIQNDLIRYLFADDPDDDWAGDGAPVET